MEKEKQSGNQYNYTYVSLEEVVKNPDEYIIPECLPACENLWSKNIETYMVSNYDDDDFYVLIDGLSEENTKTMEVLMQSTEHYLYDAFRKTYGIFTKEKNNPSEELKTLTEIFTIQDTNRFMSSEEFLEAYKSEGGHYKVLEDGNIVQEKNSEKENATLEEALIQKNALELYIPEEDRVYSSELYLNWHRRYLDYLNKKDKPDFK